jgi:NADPH:quinone reductase-like Zn-dependent oxidoreductase
MASGTQAVSATHERERPMQACIYETYGSAEVVKLGEVATPEPAAGEVLVSVRATSVTTADWRFRASAFPKVFWLPGRLMAGLLRPRNRVLGMDFSGVVAAVGRDVTRFRVGDSVFGATNPFRRGAHAEYLAVEEAGAIVHKPAALSHEDAAAIPFGACSAQAFMGEFAAVKPGQRVLVVGASGGVGVWAVQIARQLGAEVTAVCSTRNVELVRSLGARHVVDYTRGAVTPAGETYDVIFDTVGVTTFNACKPALTNTGIYLPLECGVREMVQALLTLRSGGKRLKYAVSANTRERLELTLRQIEAGALRPVIDQVYPMEQIAAAHRHVEGRHRRGSVVVAIGSLAA